MPRSSIIVLVVLVLAGCAAPAVAPDKSTDHSDAVADAIGAPIVADHDHSDPKLHNHSYALERTALVTGHAGNAPTGEAYAETAVKGGYAYLSRYGPESGLAIFDIKDVEHPQFVGAVRLDEGFEPDIEISDDGNWAFWETQRFPIAPTVPDVVNPISNAPHGVHIVDISDKAHPKDVGFYPVLPDGPHSITYANIGGNDILFLSVYAFAYAYGPGGMVEPPDQQRLEITQLDTSGPLPTLKKLAEYIEPGSQGKGEGNFPHDVSVQLHPFTNQTLAYVGYWNQGLVTLDVSDPAHPKEVSKYTDFGPAKYRAIHMCRAFPELLAGKHVTVCEPEIGAAQDTGYMTFIDTSDPAKPAYLSSWILPGNLTSQGLTFSPHYFDLSGGKVALASYHAGLWIIDANPDAALPRSVAFAEMPGTGVRVGIGPFSSSSGSAFDAWWVDPTHVIAGDSSSGLSAYRLTGDT
ncbi:MAG: hypothetical protein WDA16_14900 [Candidatus Thermoplasmatota archaeon]